MRVSIECLDKLKNIRDASKSLPKGSDDFDKNSSFLPCFFYIPVITLCDVCEKLSMSLEQVLREMLSKGSSMEYYFPNTVFK